MIMEEGRIFSGIGDKIYFCRQEDIGTDKEQWREGQLGRFKVCDAEDTPGPDTGAMAKERKGFSNTFTISFEPSEKEKQRLILWYCKMKKSQKGNRHYRRKLLKHVSKKTVRHYLYELRKRCIKSYMP